MPAKRLLFGDEARFSVLRGATELTRAVKVTLVPRGRNALLDKTWGAPTITKDGVTVAKALDLSESYENMGAQLLREVASKTTDVAGDGTTTATVLAEAIFREGVKHLIAGASAMELRRGIDQGVAMVVAELKAVSRPVKPKTRLPRSPQFRQTETG